MPRLLNPEQKHSFIIPCDCGCSIISVARFDEYDRTIYLSFLSHYKLLGSFWERINLIFDILRGRERQLYDIVVNEKEYEEFIKFISETKNMEITPEEKEKNE